MYQTIGNSETGRDRTWLSQDSTRKAELVGEIKHKRERDRERVFSGFVLIFGNESACVIMRAGWLDKSKSQQWVGQAELKQSRNHRCSLQVLPTGRISSSS